MNYIVIASRPCTQGGEAISIICHAGPRAGIQELSVQTSLLLTPGLRVPVSSTGQARPAMTGGGIASLPSVARNDR